MAFPHCETHPKSAISRTCSRAILIEGESSCWGSATHPVVLCQGCVLGVLLGQSSALLSGCWREGSKISKRAVSKLGTQQSTGNCLFQQEANGFGGPLILRRNGCTFVKTISQRAPEKGGVMGRGSFPLRTTFCWGRAESCSF